MEEEQQKPQEKVKEVHHYHYKEKKVRFKPGRLFAGILVIMIGIFLLMSKMGLVEVNMELGIWDLWPVIVILIGLSMMSFRGFLGILVGVVVALVAAVIVFSILFGHLNITGDKWNDLQFEFEFSTNEIFNNK